MGQALQAVTAAQEHQTIFLGHLFFTLLVVVGQHLMQALLALVGQVSAAMAQETLVEMQEMLVRLIVEVVVEVLEQSTKALRIVAVMVHLA
jgi:hypothetical protein